MNIAVHWSYYYWAETVRRRQESSTLPPLGFKRRRYTLLHTSNSVTIKSSLVSFYHRSILIQAKWNKCNNPVYTRSLSSAHPRNGGKNDPTSNADVWCELPIVHNADHLWSQVNKLVTGQWLWIALGSNAAPRKGEKKKKRKKPNFTCTAAPKIADTT